MRHFKLIAILNIILSVSCTSTVKFTNYWKGKTDQNVVDKFGLPDSVSRNKFNGKTYFFNEKNDTRIVQLQYDQNQLDKSAQNSTSINHFKYIFIFDSSNNILSSYISKNAIAENEQQKSKFGNFFIKQKERNKF